MLELGVFMNGQTDLPVRQTPTGTVLPSGSLADMHASYQRGVLNQIKQGVLAEKLGFDYLWPVEHHFQPEGAEFSPNPMLMEMAVAAQTSRIRLGQYANILTWWHPLRIAEQAAMLDVRERGARGIWAWPWLSATRSGGVWPYVRVDDPRPGAKQVLV